MCFNAYYVEELSSYIMILSLKCLSNHILELNITFTLA